MSDLNLTDKLSLSVNVGPTPVVTGEFDGKIATIHVVYLRNGAPAASCNLTLALGAVWGAWKKRNGAAPSAPSNSTDVEVRHNEDLNGIEVVFPAKPDASVIAWLKENAFRWSAKQALWYARFNDELYSATLDYFSLAADTLPLGEPDAEENDLPF